MSFVFFKENNEEEVKIFVFIHIPKNAGNSIVDFFKINNYKIIRPQVLVGHLTLNETISRINYLNGYDKINTRDRFFRLRYSKILRKLDKATYFYVTRDPLIRYPSMYKYVKDTTPNLTGHFFENQLFNKISFDEYIDLLVSNEFYGTSHCWNNQQFYIKNANNLEYKLKSLELNNIKEDLKALINLKKDDSEIRFNKVNTSNSSSIKLSEDIKNKIYNFDKLFDDPTQIK